MLSGCFDVERRHSDAFGFNDLWSQAGPRADASVVPDASTHRCGVRNGSEAGSVLLEDLPRLGRFHSFLTCVILSNSQKFDFSMGVCVALDALSFVRCCEDIFCFTVCVGTSVGLAWFMSACLGRGYQPGCHTLSYPAFSVSRFQRCNCWQANLRLPMQLVQESIFTVMNDE
jgi:hypothetical protein